MQTILSGMALILLCMGSAQAQLAGQDTNIKERFGLEPTSFEKALQASPKINGQNLSDNPNDRSFNYYKQLSSQTIPACLTLSGLHESRDD